MMTLRETLVNQLNQTSDMVTKARQVGGKPSRRAINTLYHLAHTLAVA